MSGFWIELDFCAKNLFFGCVNLDRPMLNSKKCSAAILELNIYIFSPIIGLSDHLKHCCFTFYYIFCMKSSK